MPISFSLQMLFHKKKDSDDLLLLFIYYSAFPFFYLSSNVLVFSLLFFLYYATRCCVCVCVHVNFQRKNFIRRFIFILERYFYDDNRRKCSKKGHTATECLEIFFFCTFLCQSIAFSFCLLYVAFNLCGFFSISFWVYNVSQTERRC